MSLPLFIKNHFKIFFLFFLFFLGTLCVFFSVASLFILSALGCIIILLRFISQKELTLFIYQSFEVSISVYFGSLLFMFIYTPEWVKKLSLYLERYSFFTIFSTGSFMYGRLFISFLLFSILLTFFYIFHRYKNKQ